MRQVKKVVEKGCWALFKINKHCNKKHLWME